MLLLPTPLLRIRGMVVVVIMGLRIKEVDIIIIKAAEDMAMIVIKARIVAVAATPSPSSSNRLMGAISTTKAAVTTRIATGNRRNSRVVGKAWVRLRFLDLVSLPLLWIGLY